MILRLLKRVGLLYQRQFLGGGILRPGRQSHEGRAGQRFAFGGLPEQLDDKAAVAAREVHSCPARSSPALLAQALFGLTLAHHCRGVRDAG